MSGKADDKFHFTVRRFRGREEIPGSFFQPAKGKAYKIFFVTAGFLVCNVDLNPIRLNRKDFHLSTFRQITSLEKISENMECYYCSFDENFLEKIYIKDKIEKEIDFVNSFLSYYPLRLTEAVYERMEACFRNMDELSGGSDAASELVHLYLVALIYEAKRLIVDGGIEIYPTRPYLVVKKYEDLLSRWILKHRKVKFYADALNITPNHLNKSVKEVSGKTALSMMNRMTVLEAKVRLKNTNLTISEIAYELGFSELSSFSKFFKRATGKTPLDYREEQND